MGRNRAYLSDSEVWDEFGLANEAWDSIPTVHLRRLKRIMELGIQANRMNLDEMDPSDPAVVARTQGELFAYKTIMATIDMHLNGEYQGREGDRGTGPDDE